MPRAPIQKIEGRTWYNRFRREVHNRTVEGLGQVEDKIHMIKFQLNIEPMATPFVRENKSYMTTSYELTTHLILVGEKTKVDEIIPLWTEKRLIHKQKMGAKK